MPGPRPFQREPASAGDDPPSPHGGQPRAPAGPVAWYAEGLSDPIGDRLQLFDASGPALELLRFHQRLTDSSAFEAALRAHAARVEGFRHPAFARVRRVTVLDDPRPQLALVSDHVAGERLSAVLRTARLAGLRAHTDAVIRLLRQAVPALVDLHEHTGGVAHGALTPDRLVVTRAGDLVVIEPAVGPALGALGLSRAALWAEFGIAQAPTASGLADPRTDIYQIALVATTLLIGRPVRSGEYPHGMRQLLDQVRRGLPGAQAEPLSKWLCRALEVQWPGFASPADAASALEAIVPGEIDGWTTYLIPETSTAQPASSGALVRTPRPATLLFPEEAPAAPPAIANEPQQLHRSRNRWRGVAAVLGCAVLAEAAWLVRASPGPPASRPGLERAADAPQMPGVPRVAAVAPVVALRESHAMRATGVPARATQMPTARAMSHGGPPVAGPTIGWIRVDAPVQMDVYANGRLIGTAAHARFRVSPGTHQITLVNQARRFRSTQAVTVGAGETLTLTPAVVPQR